MPSRNPFPKLFLQTGKMPAKRSSRVSKKYPCLSNLTDTLCTIYLSQSVPSPTWDTGCPNNCRCRSVWKLCSNKRRINATFSNFLWPGQLPPCPTELSCLLFNTAATAATSAWSPHATWLPPLPPCYLGSGLLFRFSHFIARILEGNILKLFTRI